MGGFTMPREARRKNESGMYHVMLRGINRQTIFRDSEDCEKYLQCLGVCKEKSGFVLYAYCLMGNHIHLLMKEGKEPLAQIFRRIGARYVFWYNWKYKRSGHLFQDRFKSEPINEDRQFIAVLRYIYQNPVKAKLASEPETYPWSSFRLLREENALIDQKDIEEIVPLDQLHALMAESAEDAFIDLEPDKRITDPEALELIKAVCKAEGSRGFSELMPKQQEKCLMSLHEKGCSLRQMERITGVTKSKIDKMIKQVRTNVPSPCPQTNEPSPCP